MEALKVEKFINADLLTKYVNYRRVKIVSITQNKKEYSLFYKNNE